MVFVSMQMEGTYHTIAYRGFIFITTNAWSLFLRHRIVVSVPFRDFESLCLDTKLFKISGLFIYWSLK